MTTIDPYDYDDNSFEGTYLNIQDPEINIGNTINGRELAGTNWKSDWNVSLNNLAGFTPDDGEDASHRAALAWYAGTANLTGSKLPSENGETIYRRLGDLKENNITDVTKTWYTPDHTNASFTHGDTKAPWEGIGTGWFNSVLGGGSQLRPYFDGGKKKKNELSDFEDYLKKNRVSVYEDNTSIAAMRGDFAVPTLFNGNFDAIFYPNSIQNIPGWYSNRTNNQLKQSALIDVAGIPGATPPSNGIPNYALLLEAGKSTQATHDSFVVPDWGNLRFDVFAPVRSGELNVKLETIDGQSKD
ncbi:MAG: DNA/RNA non-specific endonuclease, partial [Microcoleus sp. PH2017_27_LUM_O_A]|nr:DNA/RNA non-specific endonuclease [Microcoleus sp. PH2017_27_LUM_O_A]